MRLFLLLPLSLCTFGFDLQKTDHHPSLGFKPSSLMDSLLTQHMFSNLGSLGDISQPVEVAQSTTSFSLLNRDLKTPIGIPSLLTCFLFTKTLFFTYSAKDWNDPFINGFTTIQSYQFSGDRLVPSVSVAFTISFRDKQVPPRPRYPPYILSRSRFLGPAAPHPLLPTPSSVIAHFAKVVLHVLHSLLHSRPQSSISYSIRPPN